MHVSLADMARCKFNKRTNQKHQNSIAIHFLVHFKKKTFADNLLAPVSSKMSTSFFLQLKRN